jgi:hypothetical protein
MLAHEVFKTADFWNVTSSSTMKETSHILCQQSPGTEYKELYFQLQK